MLSARGRFLAFTDVVVKKTEFEFEEFFNALELTGSSVGISALVAPHAFSPSGQRIHENDESRAEETKLKKEIERLVNLEFEHLYGEVKQEKNRNKQKFHVSDTKIAKKYKEV